MTKYNAKTVLFALLVISLAVPVTANTAYADDDAQETKYSKSYIQRMFAELEPVMVYDENKYLSLNQTAVQWYGFSPYDVEFAQEYITVNNNLIDAMASGGNVTEALLPITEGKFSGIFDESKRVKRGFWDSSACGGSLSNPHTSYREYVQSDLDKNTKTILLEQQGYHSITLSLDSSVEFAKLSTESPVCNDGPLRDQATLNSAGYAWQPLEPNPELLEYDAPTYWWNGYTIWWHVIYNEDGSVVVGEAPANITKPF